MLVVVNIGVHSRDVGAASDPPSHQANHRPPGEMETSRFDFLKQEAETTNGFIKGVPYNLGPI